MILVLSYIDSYSFEVVATDQGEDKQLSDRTRVYINITDYNDNPPVFSQPNYNGVVSETAQPGFVFHEHFNLNKQANQFPF